MVSTGSLCGLLYSAGSAMMACPAGMRLLVSTLVESIPLMVDVVVLMVWLFFVFGIIGMQLMQGG